MLQSVQASVVVHGRHRPSSIMAYWELLIPTSNATSNLTPFCNTPTLHSMAYCLFSVLAFPWFTIQYANVLWWNKTEKVTLFNSSHSYTHTTDCHLMHYGSLTVILWVQPHMMIGYMHNSLNHSLPLTVCMALTFILCRKSAPKVSHSSCTRLWWP